MKYIVEDKDIRRMPAENERPRLTEYSNAKAYNNAMDEYLELLSQQPTLKRVPNDGWVKGQIIDDETDFKIEERWNPVQVEGVTNSGIVYEPGDYAVPIPKKTLAETDAELIAFASSVSMKNIFEEKREDDVTGGGAIDFESRTEEWWRSLGAVKQGNLYMLYGKHSEIKEPIDWEGLEKAAYDARLDLHESFNAECKFINWLKNNLTKHLKTNSIMSKKEVKPPNIHPVKPPISMRDIVTSNPVPSKVKKHVFICDWYLNEYGNKVEVIAVARGWCMVREGNKKPFVVSEEFVLATFNP